VSARAGIEGPGGSFLRVSARFSIPLLVYRSPTLEPIYGQRVIYTQRRIYLTLVTSVGYDIPNGHGPAYVYHGQKAALPWAVYYKSQTTRSSGITWPAMPLT
jgi:hypothetical protein